MKQRLLLSFIMLCLAAFSWAATGTEVVKNNGTANTTYQGLCYSIDGQFIAGNGNGQAGNMQNKGLKLRTNVAENQLVINVTEGFTIRALRMEAISNYVYTDGVTEGACIAVTKVEVDGEEVAFTGGTIPQKESTQSGNLTVTDINAAETITLYFDNSNSSGAQINAYFELDWEMQVSLDNYKTAKTYDFTTMGDVTLAVQSTSAGNIYNAGNNRNMAVYFCTNEGLENLAVQQVIDSSNKGWTIKSGNGLLEGAGAGRCAAIAGIKAGDVVEFVHTSGTGFYTLNDGSDAGIKKVELTAEEGHHVYYALEDGMIGFEIERGKYVKQIVISQQQTNVPQRTIVTPTAATLMVGATIQLEGMFIGGDFTGQWVSSDETVATVTSEGVVTGVAPGTATITYQWADDQSKEAYKASAEITVINEPQGTTVTPTEVYLEVGSTATLTGSFEGGNFTGQWVSSDETVATVTSEGIVTAIAAGTATITFQWADDQSKEAFKASAQVTVVSVDLNDYKTNKTYDFTAMGDVTLTVQSASAGNIYNAANSRNNAVYFCTNEGLENLAVQQAIDSNNKGWTIKNGNGLLEGAGAGRCAAIAGIKAGDVVEFVHTSGTGFYTLNDGSDAGIKKVELTAEEGHHVYYALEDGMIGFELDKGQYVKQIVIKKEITEVPSAPTASPAGGTVDGLSTVTLSGDGTIYYQLTSSADVPEVPSVLPGNWTKGTTVTMPNETATLYLHAFAANKIGNSPVATTAYNVVGAYYYVAEYDGVSTLTFKAVSNIGENMYDASNTGDKNPEWYDYRAKITSVVFDASFAGARPTSCYCWFSGMYNLTTITGIEYLNTGEVTNMRYMFNNCSSLTSLDMSNFNTANVTSMSYMFYGCSSLTSLDLRNFNTENVRSMYSMFNRCSSLTSLDVSNFNTANVTDMDHMFEECSSLTSLDVSNFNTANVTDMEQMFYGCSSLTSLDVSNFNTANVTSMKFMFYGCSSLTSLDLSNFNTENVTDMSWIFGVCSSLTSLDVSSFNTENVTSMWYMFHGCSALTSLDLSNFNTENVTSMEGMFSGCSSLTSLDLSSFNTENVKDMYRMFSMFDEQHRSSSSKLTSLDIKNFNTKNVTDMIGMFEGCSSLTSLDLSNFNTENVTSMSDMFYSCSSLTSLDLSNFNTENVTSMSDMFYGCTELTSFDLTNFNTANVTWMDGMFDGCSSLTSLDLSNFNTANVRGMNSMFSFCSSLTSLYLSNFNTENVTDMSSMFWYCSSLTSLDLSNFNTANVTDMEQMFKGCSSLTSLDVSNFNTANVTDMQEMFYSCSSLTSLDLSNFNTENVTDMREMFSSCSSLTSLDLSNFNTANVTYMQEMFSNCKSLTSLDLSSYNTEKVKWMYQMFRDCSKLETIYVSERWNTDKVTGSSYEMFKDCTALVGGQGTTYDANKTDATYARIDGGTEAPGYFTAKTAPIIAGDVNGDDEVDITDATIIVYYVLGRTSNLNLTAADINGDGEVDITDATIIVYRSLGRNVSPDSVRRMNMVEPQ